MRTIHSFRTTGLLLAGLLGWAVGATLLPDNEYQRWQLLNGSIEAGAKWIYERANFDPTPIDVAFLGPSRIGAAVEAPRLQQALAERGTKANVVNFSLPEDGRNLMWLVAQQLFKKNHPKLVVIGIIEKPSRKPHPAFKYLAPVNELANPGYLVDPSYFSDLIYAPYRQVRLFGALLAPGLAGIPVTFDAASYPGSTNSSIGGVKLPDGRVLDFDHPASEEQLRIGVIAQNSGFVQRLLPPQYADYEFGDERHGVREIARMANEAGSQVVFLFLPYWSGPTEPLDAEFYQQYGPIWNGGFLASHSDWYRDLYHVTRTGAYALTDFLIDPVFNALNAKASKP